MGSGEGDWGGKREVSLQATWDQSGQGSHHTQRRYSKLVRGTREQGRVLQAEGELSRGLSRGFVKGLSRGLCHVLSYIVNPVYIVLLCVCRLIKELCLGHK
jgi:hypothetical protein